MVSTTSRLTWSMLASNKFVYDESQLLITSPYPEGPTLKKFCKQIGMRLIEVTSVLGS